ncbi:hypothetical protein LINPERHAP1_LOCUS36269, partial [Linum perenne]
VDPSPLSYIPNFPPVTTSHSGQADETFLNERAAVENRSDALVNSEVVVDQGGGEESSEEEDECMDVNEEEQIMSEKVLEEEIASKGRNLAKLMDLSVEGSREEAVSRIKETTKEVFRRRSHSVPKSKKERELRRIDWTVAEVVSIDSARRSRYTWHIPLTVDLRGGAEEERLQLLATLEAVPAGWISQGPPAPVWRLSSTCLFSVSSFYRTLSLQVAA